MLFSTLINLRAKIENSFFRDKISRRFYALLAYENSRSADTLLYKILENTMFLYTLIHFIYILQEIYILCTCTSDDLLHMALIQHNRNENACLHGKSLFFIQSVLYLVWGYGIVFRFFWFFYIHFLCYMRESTQYLHI